MRVLFLSAEYPPLVGGVGDYTRQLAEALLCSGHEVAVLTGVGDELPPVPGAGSSLQLLRRVRSWGWGLTGVVRHAIEEFKPEVLHIQYQTGAYAMHPAINLLPRRLGARRPVVVVTCHDLFMPYLFPKAGPLRRWVTRQLLDWSDAVVVTNEVDRLRLLGQGDSDPKQFKAQKLLPRPVTVIPIGSNIPPHPPPGYSRSATRASLGAGDTTILIAYFGLVSYTKGLDLLLEALTSLPERFRLVVIGGEAQAPEDRRFASAVVEQIARLGLLNRVVMTGQLSAPEVSAHLLAADIAALPFRDGASYRRGSLLAALSHGLPAVTTRPPLALNPPLDEAALLVPPGDVVAIRAALAELAADPALRNRLAQRGMALAAGFDWPSIARKHEELYRQLLSDHSLSLAAD